MIRPIIIAIDGPAASGKGTLARMLARHLGLAHLDTGTLYRAVGRDVLAKGGEPADPAAAAEAARHLDPATLDDPRLREAAVAQAASIVAVHPAVRAALLDFQRDVAHRPPGAVLDGRDIGTVVCPEADLKLYVTADLAARAGRRLAELQAKGHPLPYEAVLEELRIRDARDSGRAAAPMACAADAVQIDTTDLDIEQAFAAVVAAARARLG
jgi:cytidylate kinase